MATHIFDSDVEKELKPTCGICEKEVDEMHCFADYRNDETVILVRCHGEEDRCSLNRHDFQEMLYSFKIGKGRAFNKKQIENVRQIDWTPKREELTN